MPQVILPSNTSSDWEVVPLAPPFDWDGFEYEAVVANEANAATIHFVAAYRAAHISLTRPDGTGAEAPGGGTDFGSAGSAPLQPLAVGRNLFRLTVTAEVLASLIRKRTNDRNERLLLTKIGWRGLHLLGGHALYPRGIDTHQRQPLRGCDGEGSTHSGGRERDTN